MLIRSRIVGVLVVVTGTIAYFPLRSLVEARQAHEVASQAGCSATKSPPDLGNSHLSPGQSFSYPRHPPTSGSHDPSPLGPTPVYKEPVPETRAVHSLEHAYVLIYYRKEGEGALAPAVLKALEDLASGESKVIVAPYPNLDGGVSLALTAWDELRECPSTISAKQAVAVARSFISSYRGDGRAPEPAAP